MWAVPTQLDKQNRVPDYVPPNLTASGIHRPTSPSLQTSMDQHSRDDGQGKEPNGCRSKEDSGNKARLGPEENDECSGDETS